MHWAIFSPASAPLNLSACWTVCAARRLALKNKRSVCNLKELLSLPVGRGLLLPRHPLPASLRRALLPDAGAGLTAGCRILL